MNEAYLMLQSDCNHNVFKYTHSFVSPFSDHKLTLKVPPATDIMSKYLHISFRDPNSAKQKGFCDLQNHMAGVAGWKWAWDLWECFYSTHKWHQCQLVRASWQWVGIIAGQVQVALVPTLTRSNTTPLLLYAEYNSHDLRGKYLFLAVYI